MRPGSIFVLTCFTLTCFALPASAKGFSESRLAAIGQAYAAKWKLKPRIVPIDRKGSNGAMRQTNRMYVPITNQAQYEDFVANCTGKSCMIRWTTDISHPHFFFDKTKHMVHYTKPWSGKGMSLPLSENYNDQGFIIPLALDAPKLKYVKAFLGKYHPLPYGEAKTNAMQSAFSKKFLGGTALRSGSTHCMWWWNYMHVSDKVSLPAHCGISRASKPDTMVKRLMHFGNEAVGPIGVFVKDMAAFKQMSDGQLLGAPPSGTSNVY